jgi:hypothetical protein
MTVWSGLSGSACPGALDLLCTRVDLGWADAERVGDLEDAGEAWVALSPLHPAVVGAVDAALQGEGLLGDAAFLA